MGYVAGWGNCPPLLDYNPHTKWQLTTEIYLANASPETFTEITIAKLACLARRERGWQRPAAAGQSQTAPATATWMRCPLCALTPSHLAYQCQTQTISVLSLGRIASHQRDSTRLHAGAGRNRCLHHPDLGPHNLAVSRMRFGLLLSAH